MSRVPRGAGWQGRWCRGSGAHGQGGLGRGRRRWLAEGNAPGSYCCATKIVSSVRRAPDSGLPSSTRLYLGMDSAGDYHSTVQYLSVQYHIPYCSIISVARWSLGADVTGMPSINYWYCAGRGIGVDPPVLRSGASSSFVCRCLLAHVCCRACTRIRRSGRGSRNG